MPQNCREFTSMNIKEEMKCKEQKCYRGNYRNISYKIILHSIGEEYTPAREGIWNFYVYLNENKVKDFGPIWLDDKIMKFSEESRGYISHDYYVEPLNSLEFHGGITFYAKHGHTDGFRCVEIGCDYNHLWDMERGSGYKLEDILYDVKACIDSIYANNLIKE